jgi:hypothetical protein
MRGYALPLCARAAVAAALMLLPLDAACQLIISEFRVRGPNGANDEYVVVSNPAAVEHTVASVSGTGYGVVASNGVLRFSIPNGTVIPAFGSYLGVNSVGYSLASYPAGPGTTATGNATYATDIPDNAGIALFKSNIMAGFILANRMDAVGSTSEANVLYKEGTGYPALVPFSIDYTFTRDRCGKGGSITTGGVCTQQGRWKDTNNNAADFVFLDTNGTSAGAGQRLGAPGPQNLNSPVIGGNISNTQLDTCLSEFLAGNMVRSFISDPANNSTFGTIDIRRTFTNRTGVPLTKLRFRVVDETTFPAPGGFADLRIRTSGNVVVTVDRPPCGSGTSNVTVRGSTLEQPPSQPNGSAFGASVDSGVSNDVPLAAGASINVRFLFGIQQTGTFRVGLIVEGTPAGSKPDQMVYLEGCTDGCTAQIAGPTDLEGDRRSDVLYRNISTGQVYSLRMDGFGITSEAMVYTEPNLAWKIVGDGDFNGDGITDLLWRNSATGQVYMLLFNTSGLPAAGAVVYTEINSDWKIVATPDINGDLNADILWWNSATGQVYAILMDGFTKLDQGLVFTEPNTNWKPAALGDMGGVGRSNRLIWHNAATGQVWMTVIHYGAGNFTTSGQLVYTAANLSWKVIGAPDLNGDGKSDILWRNSATGQVYGLIMDGGVVTSQGMIYSEADLAWEVVAIGDYNGDGRADLLYRNASTGQLYMLRMYGLVPALQAPIYTSTTLWHPVGMWEYAVANGILP